MKIILNKNIVFAILLLLIQSTKIFGGTITYETANQLYHNQQYTEALDLYMQMINEGVVNASVYYNAGNTYYKLNKFGWAVWCYDKALQYNPNNNIYKENLLLTTNKLSNKTNTNTNNIFINAIKKYLFFHSLNMWAIGSFLFFTIAILLVIIKKFIKLPSVFIVLRKLMWLAFSIYFIGMIGQYLFIKFYKYGIIIQNTILFNSPKEKGLNNVSNTEGLKVQILQFVKGGFLNGNKYKVKMPNGNIVWVDENSLKPL